MTTLSNGLRVLTDYVPAVDSVALGVWLDVGTRDEDLVHNGVAHMVEHMLFKGTKKRDAVQIAEEIESVGGHMNAYTSREVTAYHIHLLKEDAALALDVLADMIQHSVMEDVEVERERHVILQEIGMTLDTPDDLVFDHYQETAYPGQALGAPILGTVDIISNMSRGTLMGYVENFYTPARFVVSAAGNIRHEEMVKLVGEKFSELPANNNRAFKPATYSGGDHRVNKELEQAHFALGFKGVSRKDDDYYTAMMLATILGGGMSSRLFQEIREKRGLVYSVFSFHSPYQDDGQFVIYAGTGPDSLPELVPVLCDEILKSGDTIREGELARAKAQLRSATLMAQESMKRRADRQAKHLLFYDEILDIHERIEKMDAISIDDVQAIARKIFATRPTVAALGPLKKLEEYDSITSRLVA